MYSPTLGRFIQNDPIEYEAGDPNLYRFVGNNPTNYLDPSGLERIRVAGGTLEDKVKGDTFTLTFTGDNCTKFKVKQWVQFEVYSESEPTDSGRRGNTGWVLYQRTGMNLAPAPMPGEPAHDHAHVTAHPFDPVLQADHGGSTDGFSRGPYTLNRDGNSVTYSDTPNAAQLLIPGAQALLTRNFLRRGVNYSVCGVRIVQRFVTTAYVNGKPVRSYHWTSTSHAAWGGRLGSNPITAVVGRFATDKSPTEIIKEWAAAMTLD